MNRLTTLIALALVLGLAAGMILHAWLPESAPRYAELAALLPAIFLRLIKMIIAPLVFATLVVGIGKMGDVAMVGKVGGKSLAWFIFASLISLTLGLILVETLQPGAAMHLTPPPAGTSSGIGSGGLSLETFIEHTIPTSIVDAMSRNEIPQIVVFAVFFGAALASFGERGALVTQVFESVSQIMLKVTGYVMQAAPFAVFGALMSTVAREGIDVIGVYGLFVAEFYLGIVLLWVVLVLLGVAITGPRILGLVRGLREPVLLAFSTASSEAAYPRTLEELERHGISNRIASFVLPVGYSFNLDGSMMYCTFAVMFIAQVYGIAIPLHDQILMVAILMLTSKGIAGVPRASLVVIAATLAQFNIPEAGLLLLLGVDHFLDMGRSATNVIGNSIATAVVAKWQGETLNPALSRSTA